MMMYFSAVVFITLALAQGIPSDKYSRDSCHVLASTSCQSHSYDNMTYCASDGQRYQGLCSFLLAACDHHLSVLGYGETCTHPTAHPPTTHPPPSQLDIALYMQLIHNIDYRLKRSRAKGIPPEEAKRIFSQQDNTNKIYIRNKNCWAYDLDLSPISPWNSDLGNRKAGTLVSPKHVIGARHFNSKVNSTVRFIDINNNVIERIVIRTAIIKGPDVHGLVTQDLVVEELDSDVPATITFAKVMPQNLTTFGIPYNLHAPALTTDLEEKALVDDVYFYSTTSAGLLVPSLSSIRHEYYELKTSGDSGSPSFFILDDKLVLWLVFDGVDGGSAVNQYYDEINGILAGGGYSLTEIDLSKFLKNTPHVIGK